MKLVLKEILEPTDDVVIAEAEKMGDKMFFFRKIITGETSEKLRVRGIPFASQERSSLDDYKWDELEALDDWGKTLKSALVGNDENEKKIVYTKQIADIIIPHHNRHDMLTNVLDKLNNTLFYIHIESGGSFAENCNRGAKNARTENLIFMNDDIIPDEETLIRACNMGTDIVGFTQMIPSENNKVIHGIGWQVNEKGEVLSNLKTDNREVHIPSGFLILVKKTAWKKLKGFDETFINSTEDVDFGLRAKEKGLTFGYIRKPIIHHHSQSEGRYDNIDENHKHFGKLWSGDRIKKAIGLDKPSKRVLISNNFMQNLGGSETFTYTLGKELEKRGYKVDLFTPMQGQVSEDFYSISNIMNIQKEYEYLFINHNTCLDLILKSERGKGIKIFTSHGTTPELEQPIDGADFYVAISEEVKQHMKKLGYKAEVIMNGIDCDRFTPKDKLNTKAKRVLSLCKNDNGHQLVEEACQIAGLEFTKANGVWRIEDLINKADIVVTLGRGAYEAMACGRAVVVYDNRLYNGSIGDGMITKDNIGKLVKKNCSGRAFNKEFTAKELAKEFKKYNVSMGKLNRNYAVKHFNIKTQLDKYFAIIEKDNNRVVFVGSSDTEYGIAKQLEKQLKKNGFNIGYGGKRICYANDLCLVDPDNGGIMIPEKRKAYIRAINSGADIIFYSQKDYAKMFPKNSIYLPSGVDSEIFKDMKLERNVDIGFVGSTRHKNRKDFIEYMQKKYPNFEYRNGIFFKELAEFYNQCKIVVNHAAGGEINMRMFEATASGALLITSYVDHIDEFFKKNEIVTYKTIAELDEKIKYYLKHKKQRDKIAKAGQRRTLSEHTYQERIKVIIDAIK